LRALQEAARYRLFEAWEMEMETIGVIIPHRPIGSKRCCFFLVLHGSHQYTPFMLAYMPYMDPMGIGVIIHIWVNFITTSLFSRALEIMVNKGNHPKLAEQFRLVKNYNLPRHM